MNKYNEAINICLTTIGLTRVGSTASITGNYEAELADYMIEEVLNEVLSHKYNFNTDTDYPLVPDSSNVVAIPAMALSVDLTDRNQDYIVRDGKLYNKVTQKDNDFDTTVYADVTWKFAFDDLHAIVQNYIVALAKQRLYARVVGTDNYMNVLMQETQDAKIAMLHEDMQSGDYSIFDSTDVRRPMNRTQNPNAI